MIVGVVSAGMPTETVEITKEMEFPAHKVNLGDFQSPLTTYRGSIYFDYPYLAETGHLRYQAQSGGMVKVYTARFSGSPSEE
jgi:hypothetical protein